MENNEKTLVAKAGSAYSHGWQVLRKYFISLFLVSLVVMVASFPLGAVVNLGDLHHDQFGIVAIAVVFGQIFAIAYSLFLLSPLNFGMQWTFLKSARDEKFEVNDVFAPFKNYLNVVLASLLAGAIIVFGFFFLIIPGVVFACRLAFVPYLVMDKDLDPVKAVEESWRLTRGYGWRILWMAMVGFFIFILGLICLVFGAFVSVMWINAAFASFYHAVMEEKGENVIIPAE